LWEIVRLDWGLSRVGLQVVNRDHLFVCANAQGEGLEDCLLNDLLRSSIGRHKGGTHPSLLMYTKHTYLR
jgi:hypothetical protein